MFSRLLQPATLSLSKRVFTNTGCRQFSLLDDGVSRLMGPSYSDHQPSTELSEAYENSPETEIQSNEGTERVIMKVEVPWYTASKIVGMGGKTITEIREQTLAGVHLDDFKGSASPAVGVSLIGSWDSVFDAQSRILNLMQETTTEMEQRAPMESNMILSKALVGKLIGVNGGTIASIQNSTRAIVQVFSSPARHAIAVIRGQTQDQVSTAEQKIRDAMGIESCESDLPTPAPVQEVESQVAGSEEEPTTRVARRPGVSLFFPSDFTAHIIGRQGDIISQMKKDAGVEIYILSDAHGVQLPEGPVRVVQIVGDDCESVIKAKGLMQARIDEIREERERKKFLRVQMRMPRGKLKYLFEDNGAALQALRTDTGVEVHVESRFQVSRGKVDANTKMATHLEQNVTMVGTKECVQAAQKLMLKTIINKTRKSPGDADWNDNVVLHSLTINREDVGAVIGKGGVNIQAMGKATRTRIQVGKLGWQTRKVTVNGPKEGVQQAVEMIKDVIARNAQKTSEKQE